MKPTAPFRNKFSELATTPAVAYLFLVRSMRATLFIAIGLLLSPAATGKESRPLNSAQCAQLSVYTPKPDYPFEARARRITGSGIFRLHFQLQSGLVKSYQIERSTGHSMLDAAATRTLRRWRFNPQALRTYADAEDKKSGEIVFKVPVIYQMR